jgi:hypothetical protein
MSKMRDPFIDPQPGDVIEVNKLKAWIVKERTNESVVFDADEPGGTEGCEWPLGAWQSALEGTKTARVICRG